MATASLQLSLGELAGNRRRRRRERVIRGIFFGAAAVSILISGLILFSVLGKSIEFLSKITPSQLLAGGWYPRQGDFGIATIVAGTFVVAAIAMMVAAPLGLGAAIYLSEYARPRVRRTFKPILEVLAGIPSVVLGYFALNVISPDLVEKLFSSASLFNLMAAGIAVGVLVTPLVASVAEDAMFAVPGSLREASYGLGAKKQTTSLHVVFPAAASGIVAALILGISRAVGETMIVAIASGATGNAAFSLSPLHPGQTMTAAMSSLAIGSDQVGGDPAAVQSLFFVGLLLFAITFLLNLFADRFVRRIRSQY